MSERNYWPHFILALVVFAIVLGVWTIRVAMEHPVELDNSFMMSYREVDENYYQIEQAARAFDKRYRVELRNEILRPGEPLRIVVQDHAGTPIPNAQVEILLTRPETSKYDRRLMATFVGDHYEAQVDYPLEGRWDVVVRVRIGDLFRYFKFKRSTRRIIEDKP
ncbi:MAG: hypothetical protein C6I00_05965 [Nitratiruptor sp.]|nr:hypothetical protein [Nitratiruptor sp.]NPA82988.1 hypothetical protein [Campylobacterota bacterium]